MAFCCDKVLLTMRLLISFALFTLGLSAQQTRTEVVKPATPEDSRPNRDSVPDVSAVSGQFKRVLVLRFKHQADLLAGIQSIVEKEKIRNGVFLSAIGSVRNYHVHVVTNRTFPPKDVFMKNTTEPADIIGLSGHVIDGRVHAHMTMASADKAFGGHLEPGTNVFTFAMITLGDLGDSVDIRRGDEYTLR